MKKDDRIIKGDWTTVGWILIALSLFGMVAFFEISLIYFTVVGGVMVAVGRTKKSKSRK